MKNDLVRDLPRGTWFTVNIEYVPEKQQAKNKLDVFQVDKETWGMFCQGHLSVFALLQRSDTFPEKVPEFGTGGDLLQ